MPAKQQATTGNMNKRQPKKVNETTFKKGVSGNPAGRKKGTENKRTKEQREAFEVVMELLEKRMMEGNDVINNLSPHRASELYTNMLNYKKPKLSQTKNESEVKQDVQIKVNFAPFNKRFLPPEDSVDSTGEGTDNG